MGWKKSLRVSWKLRAVSGQRPKQRSVSDVLLVIDPEWWGLPFTLLALFSTVD